MFLLNKPNFNITSTYPVCVSLVTDDNIRVYLEKLSREIYAYANQYDQLATTKKLNELPKNDKFLPETDTRNLWLVKLYTYYFAKSTTERTHEAHAFYKQIFRYDTDETVRRCCYCNANKIDALDHFLPESKYHALSVNPMNLVPACDHCNEKKGAYEPDPIDVKSVLIHPYYDNILMKPWLKVNLTSQVIKGIKRISSFFYVNPQISSDDELLYERISNTLKTIKLNDNLCHIADEFINIEIIPDLRDGEYAGKNDDDLRMLFKSKATRLCKQGYGLNHWKIAIYDNLSTRQEPFSYLY